MKTNRKKGVVLTALLLVAMTLPAVSGSIDKQVPVNRTISLTKAEMPGKNTMLARNSTAKAEAAATTTAPAKTHDKKAVGRCWSRLMGMFREINIAHRNRTR